MALYGGNMSANYFFRLVNMMAGDFGSYSTTYTTPGTSTIPIPKYANYVKIEAIGAGGPGAGATDPTSQSVGGGGGAFAKVNLYPLAGLTGLYIGIPDNSTVGIDGTDCFVKENSSGGTLICLAAGGDKGIKGADGGGLGSGGLGGAAADCTGDTKISGGNGDRNAGLAVNGGRAAGPNGLGISPAGAMANGAVNGNPYGGGGGAVTNNSYTGASGWLKLTWLES